MALGAALVGCRQKRVMENVRVQSAAIELLQDGDVFDEVENSPVMQDLWAAYQKKFSYASDLGWDTVMAAVRQLFVRCEGAV